MTVEEVLGLSWKALGAALMRCDDEVELQCWLTATLASGKRTRSRRVQGRLNAVRRERELAALPRKAKTWRRRAKKEAA